MSPRVLQLAGSVLLLAGGGALVAFGYTLGGVVAIAVGALTAAIRKT